MNNPMHARASFQDTRWSVVIAARDKDSQCAAKALSELCGIYWYPLYAFGRSSGCGHHEAEDMTQSFFQHLLDKDGFAHVDPKKGRFRSFLLASMKHFLANERDRARAAKRGGGITFLPIDMTIAEGQYQWEPADETAPDILYDRSWALTLLNGALCDLKAEYREKERSPTFDALEHFVSGSSPAKSYAEAAQLLKTTEGNIKVLVHRLRQRFGAILRKRVADTVQSEGEIDEEIGYLMSCFTR